LNLETIIVGAGGHGRVVLDALSVAGGRIVGFTDANSALHGSRLLGVPVLGADTALSAYSKETTRLANGIGSIGNSFQRRTNQEALAKSGWRFMTVVHPRAVIAADVVLEEGVQVMAGAVLQPGVRVGTGTIINTGAVVDHDCRIGCFSHIAPGATLSGGVTLGVECHVGTGASIIQGISLGDKTVVGAGAVVVSDHPGGRTLIGVPARAVKR
jgi:UDP-perosamine 4-acetyltransferase